MPFAMRRSAGIASAIPFLVLSLCVLCAPPRGFAQDTPPPDTTQFLELEHYPSSKLPSGVLSLIGAKQRAIATEATFFGYDLRVPGWDFDQTVCPAIPDYLVLHYRRLFPNGTQSVFTALVPRGDGPVYVVPVLYRNATPFQSATGSDRSIAVFNRVVPAAVAAKALDPNGKWLTLGLCYADIVYGSVNAMQRAGSVDVGLAQAPLPLLRLSEAKGATGIVFTDRNAPGEFLVWSIVMDDKGRVTAASAQQLSDYVARIRNGAEPVARQIPEGKEPPVRMVPPGQEPPVKPMPPGQEPPVTPLPPQQEPPVKPQPQ
jgi:hypothetical protein